VKWLLIGALSLAVATPAMAKKKKPAPSATTTAKKKDDKPSPPGDKGDNDGAQGRRNATEDAARAADSSQFEHRP
jgi:hypothetical protein